MSVGFLRDRGGSLIFPPSEGDVLTPTPPRHPALRMNGHVSTPLVFTGIFSPDECELILSRSTMQPLRTGKMMYSRLHVRRSKIAWLSYGAETAWVYLKIWQTFQAVNRWFEFDLLGLVDEVQYTVYDVDDHFDWHLDTGGGQTSTRKISMSIQLCDGEGYTGGDLEFCGCAALEPSRRRGTIIVFPSFLPHRVTPIRAGRRCCLVAWAHGPVFR